MPDNLNNPIRLKSDEIDKHFDSLLYEGMPLETARLIEEQRAAAHQELKQEILRAFTE